MPYARARKHPAIFPAPRDHGCPCRRLNQCPASKHIPAPPSFSALSGQFIYQGGQRFRTDIMRIFQPQRSHGGMFAHGAPCFCTTAQPFIVTGRMLPPVIRRMAHQQTGPVQPRQPGGPVKCGPGWLPAPHRSDCPGAGQKKADEQNTPAPFHAARQRFLCASFPAGPARPRYPCQAPDKFPGRQSFQDTIGLPRHSSAAG